MQLSVLVVWLIGLLLLSGSANATWLNGTERPEQLVTQCEQQAQQLLDTDDSTASQGQATAKQVVQLAEQYALLQQLHPHQTYKQAASSCELHLKAALHEFNLAGDDQQQQAAQLQAQLHEAENKLRQQWRLRDARQLNLPAFCAPSETSEPHYPLARADLRSYLQLMRKQRQSECRAQAYRGRLVPDDGVVDAMWALLGARQYAAEQQAFANWRAYRHQQALLTPHEADLLLLRLSRSNSAARQVDLANYPNWRPWDTLFRNTVSAASRQQGKYQSAERQLSQLLSLYESAFGFSFALQQQPRWRSDIIVLSVTYRGEPRGILLLDLFDNQHKYPFSPSAFRFGDAQLIAASYPREGWHTRRSATLFGAIGEGLGALIGSMNDNLKQDMQGLYAATLEQWYLQHQGLEQPARSGVAYDHQLMAVLLPMQVHAAKPDEQLQAKLSNAVGTINPLFIGVTLEGVWQNQADMLSPDALSYRALWTELLGNWLIQQVPAADLFDQLSALQQVDARTRLLDLTDSHTFTDAINALVSARQ